MPENENWADRVTAQISTAGAVMEESDVKELQLARLVKITRRIGDFTGCGDCRSLRTGIEELVNLLGHKLNREEKRDYLGRLHLIMKHLHREHNLISEGQNLAIGMSAGIAVGMVTGSVFGNPGVGIAGLMAGLAIGAWLDSRARKTGQVI